MTDSRTQPAALPAGLRRALAAFELAAARHRGAVRRALEVSEEELTALLHLAHDGGLPQGRLGDVTELSRSGAGAMVQRLELAGFVQRDADPHDRRLRRVTLTPLGRERIARAYAELDAAASALLAGRPTTEAELLEQLLRGLAAAAVVATGGGTSVEAVTAPPGEPIWRHWS